MLNTPVKVENTVDIQEKAKIMRREGKILQRQDSLSEQGLKSVICVEYEGSQYTIQMLNGVVGYIKDCK